MDDKKARKCYKCTHDMQICEWVIEHKGRTIEKRCWECKNCGNMVSMDFPDLHLVSHNTKVNA